MGYLYGGAKWIWAANAAGAGPWRPAQKKKRAGGRRSRLKRLDPDKEIQGIRPPFPLILLAGFGRAWLNLDSAWIGLGEKGRGIYIYYMFFIRLPGRGRTRPAESGGRARRGRR